MSKGISETVAAMRAGSEIKFSKLAKVCEAYFGEARQEGTSHMVFQMPWSGDPRVNIQNKGGKAKPYQVRQVLAAIDRKTAEDNKSESTTQSDAGDEQAKKAKLKADAQAKIEEAIRKANQ